MQTAIDSYFAIGYGGLVFPPSIWGMEMSGLVLFFAFNMMRLDFGKDANRNEETKRITLFILFTLLAIAIYTYFGFFTTYVLIIDIGFAIVSLFFVFFELLCGIAAKVIFVDYSK